MPSSPILNLPGLSGLFPTSNESGRSTLRVHLWNPAKPAESVIFEVMPSISESGQANYRDLQPTQAPGGFSVYTGSSLRQFNLTDVRLLARTEREAQEKLRIQNQIRGWTKPYFGKGNSASETGLPPDVLLFSAYGHQNISRIPVVITSYNIEYPNDTDYLYLSRTAGGTPVTDASATPISSQISLNLQEVWSMRELNNFDLKKYKEGNLTDWF